MPNPGATLNNARLYALLTAPAVLVHRFADLLGNFAHERGFPRVTRWIDCHVWTTFIGTLGLLVGVAIALGVAMSDTPPNMAQASIVDSLVEPPTLAPGEYVYDIESGDSLSVIAMGNGVTVEALKARNAVTLARWETRCKYYRTENPESCGGIIWVNEGIVIPAGGSPSPIAQ